MICYLKINDTTKIVLDLLKHKEHYFLTKEYIEFSLSNYLFEIKSDEIFYISKKGYKPLKTLKINKNELVIKIYTKLYIKSLFNISTNYF